MCEAPQTGSNAKPEDTFTEVLKRIEELEGQFINKEVTLTDLQEKLYQISLSPVDKKRIKAYLKYKVIENETDVKKWVSEVILSAFTIIASIVGSAVTVKSFDESVAVIAGTIFITGIICRCIGKKFESPIKETTQKRGFYEMCLNIFE